MPEVRSAAGAGGLDAAHPVARIFMQRNGFRRDGLKEAGPAAAAVELRIALKQRRLTRPATIDSIVMIV